MCEGYLQKNCPNKLEIKVPQQLENLQLTVEKFVFSLYLETRKLKKAVEVLQEMCRSVQHNIFTAHMQCNPHEQARQNLELNTVICIED